jgi:hypothetical protein
VALATLSDLGARLGLDLDGDERAAACLADAEAAVIDYCGQDFSTEEREVTLRLSVVRGRVELPFGPVVEVDEVTSGGADVAFSWTSGRFVRVPRHLSCVDATWTYAWAEVPGVILATVCQIAGRAYGVKPQDSGRTAESIGDHSESFGSAAGSGPLGLLAGERETLDRYRRRVGEIRLAAGDAVGTFVPLVLSERRFNA